MLITRKIEISVSRKDEEQYQKSWNLLNFLNDNLYRAANTVVSHQYLNHELRNRLLIAHPKYRQLKKDLDKVETDLLGSTDRSDKQQLREQRRELLGWMKAVNVEVDKQMQSILNTSIQNNTYQIISEMFPNIPGTIRGCLNSIVLQSYNKTLKDLLQGNRSLPTYRKGMPIPFQFRFKWKKDEDDNISFTWFKGVEFFLRFGRDRSNNRIIVNRAINGEYQVKDSSIQLKKDKVFLLLVLDVGERKHELDPEVVVGVDLGINIPVYVALANGLSRQSIGSRDEFVKVRLRLQKQISEVQRGLKFTGGGRGRSKKLAALGNFKEKERNFAQTQNHIYSREVVKFALTHNAGVIQMEHLKGIGENLESKFLKQNWSYFELQKMIEYKAKYHGIEVRYVEPKYTSQTCSFCGHLEEGQRLSQKDFLCKNPDCFNKDDNSQNVMINADFNGARNIARSLAFVKKDL